MNTGISKCMMSGRTLAMEPSNYTFIFLLSSLQFTIPVPPSYLFFLVFFLLLLLFFFWDRFLLRSLDWSQFNILLPQPFKCWYYKCILPHLAKVIFLKQRFLSGHPSFMKTSQGILYSNSSFWSINYFMYHYPHSFLYAAIRCCSSLNILHTWITL
jgi:hypothetical protein